MVPIPKVSVLEIDRLMNMNNTKIKKKKNIQMLNKAHCGFLLSGGVTTGVC